MKDPAASTKNTREFSSIVASFLSVYFIEIIWHSKKIPFFLIIHFLALSLLLLLIPPFLIFLSKKAARVLLRNERKELDPWLFLVIAAGLLVWFGYTIYGNPHGPWVVRRDAAFLDKGPDDLKNVFNRQFGIAGLCITLLAWLYVNLDLFFRSRAIGVLLFVVLIVMIILALFYPKIDLNG